MDFWCSEFQQRSACSADSNGRPLLRTADKPCLGLNGTNYHMGRNRQVVGEYEHYGDYVYSQEAMRIISEHDLQVPLFYCTPSRDWHDTLSRASDLL